MIFWCMMLCCVASTSLVSIYPTMQHHTPVEFISKFTSMGTSHLLTYLYYSVLAAFTNKLIYRCVYFPSDTYFSASSDQFTLSQPVSVGCVLYV
jgi:H+/Cl- antiporter ClcA